MATEIEQVRALIGDDEAPYTFSDTTIAAFLELYEGNVFRAGGNLLMRAAVDVGLTAKMVRTDDLTVDNTKKADILFKRAELLLGQADNADSEESTFILSFWPEGGQKKIEAVPLWGFERQSRNWLVRRG